MIPLMIGAGLLQGGLGYFAAKKAQAKQKKQEAYNTAMSGLDTSFAPFVSGQTQKVEVQQAPDALGATLGGAFKGAMQGANIYQGLQSMATPSTGGLVDLLSKGAQTQAAGQGQLGGDFTNDLTALRRRNDYMNMKG